MEKQIAPQETFDNLIDWDSPRTVEGRSENEESHRGEYKYDPVAKWNYPAPYSNQKHGSGV